MTFTIERLVGLYRINVLINHQFVMKSIQSVFLAIAIAFISTSACKKNETSEAEKSVANSPQIFTDYLGKKIAKDVVGTVIDADNNPVQNASIEIGAKTTMTDSLGNFKLTNAPVNTKFAFIIAKKEDYKSTTISMVPSDTTHAKMTLHQESAPCLYWFCKSNHSL